MIINVYSPEIKNDVFVLKEKINFNSKFPFKSNNIRTVNYGMQSLGYLGPKIWTIVSEYLKELKPLNEFKTQINL